MSRDSPEHTIPVATCRNLKEFVLQLCSSDAFPTSLAVVIRRVTIVFCTGWGGGQGRNRTADAGLFRADIALPLRYSKGDAKHHESGVDRSSTLHRSTNIHGRQLADAERPPYSSLAISRSLIHIS